jgi:hypothetical protein
MRRPMILLGVLALALSACAGGGATETFTEIGSSPDGDGSFSYDQASDEQAPEDAVATGETLQLEIATGDRKVIRNASLRLEANDTRAAYEEIVQIAERSGGFVASAEVSPTTDNQQPVIQVTVRVPSSELSAALLDFKNVADTVVAESQSADDVTEAFVDLEAQLANLKALEVELRALLEEVRKQPDADPEELLRVFTEISNTRGQIEQIQGQLNYLNDAVDLATAQISLEPTPLAIPIVEEGWAPAETVRSATRTLVAALQNLGDVVITFVIAVLPMLILVLAIPALVLYLAYRYWRSRRKDQARPVGKAIPNE